MRNFRVRGNLQSKRHSKEKKKKRICDKREINENNIEILYRA